MLTGTAEMSAARDSAGDGGMSVHGGTARQFQGHSYYEYNNGQIRNGLSNCVYILRDIWEGDGGIGFVPGKIIAWCATLDGPLTAQYYHVCIEFVWALTCRHQNRLTQGKL